MRNSNSLETVECAVLRELSYIPIFVLQIIKVLHTKKDMISLPKATKYAKGRISYDFHVPQNIKEDLFLDVCNKNDLMGQERK